jgi:hypothetical protein
MTITILDIIQLPFFYERERRKKLGGGVVRDTIMVGVEETIFTVLKVPRQCQLVHLVRVSLVFRINSKF